MKRNFLLHARPNWLIDLISLIAGGITVLAFSPFNYHFIALITPAILLRCWYYCTPRRAFLRGLFFGTGLFGFGVSWIFVSIHRYGMQNDFIASILTFGLIIVLALFIAVQGYLFNKLFPKNSLTKLLIAFPTSWVIFEWIRQWLFTGFPWLYLGTSQVNGLLMGFAPIGGTFGTSWATVFCAALIFVFLTQKLLARYLALFGLCVMIFIGCAFARYNWTQAIGKPISVSLVQGNVTQTLKWDPQWIDTNIQRYVNLTHKAWHSQLVVWPENALPLPMPYARTMIDKLSTSAKKHHATIILGLPIPAVQSDENYYNGLIMAGGHHGIYYKRHLVPFGEYIPFAKTLGSLLSVLNVPMSTFIPGPNQQPLLHIAPRVEIAPFICYEIAYSHLVREALPQAHILLVISDDAWFGDSIAAWQHLQIAQMQALSAGRPILFSTNNGITALINAHGEIKAIAPRFKSYVLSGNVQPMMGQTPWSIFGNTTFIILCFLLLWVSYLIQALPASRASHKKRRHKRRHKRYHR